MKQASVLPDCVGPVATWRLQRPESTASNHSAVYGCREQRKRRPAKGPSGMTISASANCRIDRSRRGRAWRKNQRSSCCRADIAGLLVSAAWRPVELAGDFSLGVVQRLAEDLGSGRPKLPLQRLARLTQDRGHAAQAGTDLIARHELAFPLQPVEASHQRPLFAVSVPAPDCRRLASRGHRREPACRRCRRGSHAAHARRPGG